MLGFALLYPTYQPKLLVIQFTYPLPAVLKRCSTWGNPKTALFAPRCLDALNRRETRRWRSHSEGVTRIAPRFQEI
jgi:hypothetical protein